MNNDEFRNYFSAPFYTKKNEELQFQTQKQAMEEYDIAYATQSLLSALYNDIEIQYENEEEKANAARRYISLEERQK